MSGEPTVAGLRTLLEAAFERAARAGAGAEELAAAALHGLLDVRRHLDRRHGPGAVRQMLDWLGGWLLRRELRARTFGLRRDLPLPESTPAPRTRLLVGHAVEAAVAAVEAAGVPVLHLALAELLLDRLELHLGGLPARTALLERLSRDEAGGVADPAVHGTLLQ